MALPTGLEFCVRHSPSGDAAAAGAEAALRRKRLQWGLAQELRMVFTFAKGCGWTEERDHAADHVWPSKARCLL